MQRVIITGATGVIGKEAASFMEASGYEVTKCARSLGHNLDNEEFVKDWFKKNPAHHLVNLFALNDHVSEQTEETENLYNVSLDSIGRYLNTNITSLFSVCREYARNNKKGNIVNFSSVYGLVSPDPRIYKNGKHKHIGYSVSKAGVLQLTKYLAVHLAPNIRANTVIPGGVLNDQKQDFKNRYSNKCPMKRMMEAKEINGIIKYLCSDASSYCNGAEFVLDGGYTAW